MKPLSNRRFQTARVYTKGGVDLEESPAPTAGNEGKGLMPLGASGLGVVIIAFDGCWEYPGCGGKRPNCKVGVVTKDYFEFEIVLQVCC